MKRRNEEKKSRFEIEPLEERIAPAAFAGFTTGRGHGECHQELGRDGGSLHSTLEADVNGDCQV